MAGIEDCDALLDGALTPYSREEYERFHEYRKIKTLWEYTYAHTFELTDVIHEWLDYTAGKTAKPRNELHLVLRPGETMLNPARLRMNQITAYYAKFEHGAAPNLKVAQLVVKETITLIERMKELNPSKEVADIEFHFREWGLLILYHGPAKMSQGDFSKALRKHCAAFLNACDENCRVLFDFALKAENSIYGLDPVASIAQNTATLVEETSGLRREMATANEIHSGAALENLAVSTQINNTVKRIDERDKRSNISEHFPVETKKLCHDVWNAEKNNPAVKASALRRVGYKNVFHFARRILAKHNVYDWQTFKDLARSYKPNND